MDISQPQSVIVVVIVSIVVLQRLQPQNYAICYNNNKLHNHYNIFIITYAFIWTIPIVRNI